MKRGKDALDAYIAGRKRNKYGVSDPASRMVYGILFGSKREALHYKKLLGEKASGHVRFILRQTPFHLPGGVRYLVDFTVFYADGRVEFHEVKGHKTETYKVKKRLVEALFPVTIQEIR